MTEIAPYVPPAPAEIDYTWNLAAKLSKTEFVPQNLRGKPEAVLAVFLTGRELGIGPMQSLRDIYPVNGRPALMATLMVARVRGLGHRFRTITSSDRQATVQIHRKGEDEPEIPVHFTLEDAKRAGLVDKAVWRQYPKAMLWNRAAAAACRRDCPEALGGAVYTPEEIEDGHGGTTATWGAPEMPEQQSGAGSSGPTDVPGDETSGSPAPGDQSDPAPIPPGAGSDSTSDPVGRAKVSAGSDLTSGVGERETAPGRDGAAGLPMGSAADRDDPTPDDQGGGPAGDAGGKPVPTSDPSPASGSGSVVAWCQRHSINPGTARLYLAHSHKDDYGKDSPHPLRTLNDLQALAGDDAARALVYLDAQFGDAKAGQ